MKFIEASRLKKEVSCSEAHATPISVAVPDFIRRHPGMTESEAEKQIDAAVLCHEKIRRARNKEELKNEAINCYIADQTFCPLGKNKSR